MKSNQYSKNYRVKQSLFNISIDSITLEDTLRTTKSSKNKHYIVTPNVDHIVRLQKDQEFLEVYNNAHLVLPDGAPIMWAANILGTPLKEKVSGSDLFNALLPFSEKHNLSVFFLGSSVKIGEIAIKKMTQEYPCLKIKGQYSPPFGFEHDEQENNKIISMINTVNPDLLFLCLGAPKQEKWIYTHIDNLQIKVGLCVGASLDFYSDQVKRAPRWMQKIGFEWFYRMCSDPKRLIKRYLLDDLLPFAWLLIKEIKKNRLRK